MKVRGVGVSSGWLASCSGGNCDWLGAAVSLVCDEVFGCAAVSGVLGGWDGGVLVGWSACRSGGGDVWLGAAVSRVGSELFAGWDDGVAVAVCGLVCLGGEYFFSKSLFMQSILSPFIRLLFALISIFCKRSKHLIADSYSLIFSNTWLAVSSSCLPMNSIVSGFSIIPMAVDIPSPRLSRSPS